MKIAILVEGATEVAFREKLREFMQARLGQQMPRLKWTNPHFSKPYSGDYCRTIVNPKYCSCF